MESLENRLLLTAVTLTPNKDNTLYEDTGGTLNSNGSGEHFFAGRVGTNPSGGNAIRRGLLAFDVAGKVPAGATIDSVTLTLHMSRNPTGTETVALHEVLADWGEGASDAPGGEGAGTAAAVGDATWLHTSFNTSFWSSPGGDFDPTLSASTSVTGVGDYTWGSTSQMVADVQGWLDSPASNFGWLIQGRETQGVVTVKRFDSRQNPSLGFRPVMIINFTELPTPPEISIGDAAITEGDFGTRNIQFEVTLSEPSTENVTANFTTFPGTAIEGVDYVGLAGEVTFAPQDTSELITIMVQGDQTVELNERFLVRLSGAVGATLLDSEGQGTITNDDFATLSINDVTREEGNTGTTDFTFTVTLDADVDTSVSVNFDTQDETATSADGDYTDTSGTLNFAGAAGETQAITVSVGGDQTAELDESFLVDLSTIVAGSRVVIFGDGQGKGTITNDDSATLSIDDVSLNEGDTGTSSLTFTVTLDADVDSALSVNFDTADGTATIADGDYTGTGGTLNFAGNAGETQTILVSVDGDEKPERDETFVVNLSTIAAVGRNVSLDKGQGRGTIVNDDGVTLSIDDVGVVEGNTGTTDAVFMVRLSKPVEFVVIVDYNTADDTATSGQDYVATSGRLTFTEGQTSKTIAVPVNGDSLVELDERFFVNLESVQDLTIVDSQGQGTINNDDVPIDLGTIDFLELPDRDPSSGGIRYGLTAMHAGFFTVEAIFTGASDSVAMTLRDTAGNLLTNSAPVDGKQRLDWQAASSEAFVLELFGTATDVDLRLVNLLNHVGSTVTIHGTTGPDLVDFNAQNSRDITVNGVLYAFADADLDTVNIEMGDGNDLLDIQGSPLSEELIVGPREGDGVETATFAVTDPAASNPFTVTATGFEQLRAWSRTGDPDTATFHDSPSVDKLKANGEANSLVLRRKQGFADFFRRAKLFEEVKVIADVASAKDLAVFVGSPGSDQFTADAEARVYELSGPGYLFQAESFNDVVVRSEFDGTQDRDGNDITDSAKFIDSKVNDKFVGTASSSRSKGKLFSIVESFEFEITVRNFDVFEVDFSNRDIVLSNNSPGGIDKARFFDSGQNDRFVGRPNESTFHVAGVDFTARQAEQVFAFSKIGNGDTDTADLFDTDGNDLLEADGSSAKLSADGDLLELLYEVVAFEQVRAISSTGTDNVVEADVVDFLLTLDGNWQN